MSAPLLKKRPEFEGVSLSLGRYDMTAYSKNSHPIAGIELQTAGSDLDELIANAEILTKYSDETDGPVVMLSELPEKLIVSFAEEIASKVCNCDVDGTCHVCRDYGSLYWDYKQKLAKKAGG